MVCTSGGPYYGPPGDVFISQSQWEAIGSPANIRYTVSGASGSGDYCYRVLTDRVYCCSTEPDLLHGAPYLPTFTVGPSDCNSCVGLDCPPGAVVIPSRNCDPECNDDAGTQICALSYVITDVNSTIRFDASTCRTTDEFISAFPSNRGLCFECCADAPGQFPEETRQSSCSSFDFIVGAGTYRREQDGSTSNVGTETLANSGCFPSNTTRSYRASTSIPCAVAIFNEETQQNECSFSREYDCGSFTNSPIDYVLCIATQGYDSYSSPWSYVRREVQARYIENVRDNSAGDLNTVNTNSYETTTETHVIRLAIGDPNNDGIGLPSIDCGYDPLTVPGPGVLPEVDPTDPGGGNPFAGASPSPIVTTALAEVPRPSSLVNALRRITGNF